MIHIPNVKLNNGVLMPQLGLGVYQTKDGAEVESAVSAALEYGYRHIDTASLYDNEKGVGNTLRSSGIQRKELFVTTKLWNTDQGYDSTFRAFDRSIKKLGLEYIDLYLIHWPSPSRGMFVQTWKAFEELYRLGRVKAIGVSNFNAHHLDELIKASSVVPAVNQIELHPYFPQTDLRRYNEKHGIQTESWSPIGGNKGKLLEEPVLAAIGSQYDKSPAQVVIRWHIQNGLIVIPKSVHAERIEQNATIFDFELSDDDMEQISHLANNKRIGPDPDTSLF